MAITAFSAEQRKLMGIKIVQDLADFTPGLIWTDHRRPRLHPRHRPQHRQPRPTRRASRSTTTASTTARTPAIELQKDRPVHRQHRGRPRPAEHPARLQRRRRRDQLHLAAADRHASTPKAAPASHNYGDLLRRGASISGPINDHLKFRLGGNFTEQKRRLLQQPRRPAAGRQPRAGRQRQDPLFRGPDRRAIGTTSTLWAMASSRQVRHQLHTVRRVCGSSRLDAVAERRAGARAASTASADLPGAARERGGGAGCAGGRAGTHVKTLPFTANLFPGNNPGNLNAAQLHSGVRTTHQRPAAATCRSRLTSPTTRRTST